MTTSDIKKLESHIDNANDLYNTFGDSGVSDAEYDSWMDMLGKLDPNNKRIKNKKVGASVTPDKWDKYIHNDFKMGSQNKVTSFEALQKWFNKTQSKDFIVEHKLDGTSIKLIYENGRLITAATRGDGTTGENITVNVKKMGGVPATIKDPRRIVFRGEILLYKSKLSLVGGKNTRNSAAGTAKRLDGVGCQFLNVQIYSVMNWKDLGLKTVSDVISFVEGQGFTSVKNYGLYTKVYDIQNLKEKYENKKRNSIDWEIDGLIIQPNMLKDDAWDYPTRSIAYKFKAAEAVTKLLDVEWHDSGGRISPVAILEPVDLMGVTISAATLNNIEHIKKLGVKIGDMVVVSRRNDVIPCIERVSIPSSHGKDIVPPSHDKEGYPIVHETNANGDQLVYLVSTNPNSRSKIVRSILAWYTAHDAKGIAKETIESVLESGAATDLPTFYEIGLNGSTKLVNIPSFGTGKFRILNKATLLTSKTTIINFMNGVDLQGFGTSRFEAILEHINKKVNIDDFINYCETNKELYTIPGFGENTVKSLRREISDARKLIISMKSLVQVEDWEPSKKTSTKINGLSFCFTGSMGYDRKILETAVKKHGGLVSGVSKNLNYLVTNDPNSGSGKNEKADILGIKKINEKEFLDMIGGIV